MISKHDILKFVKHVHKREQGIPDRRIIHPQRDWLVGVAVFIVAIFIGLVVSLQLFEFYKNIDKQTYSADVNISSYNQALSTSVIDYYRDKQQQYASLKSGQVALVNEEIDKEDGVGSTTVDMTSVPDEEENASTTQLTETISAEEAGPSVSEEEIEEVEDQEENDGPIMEME